MLSTFLLQVIYEEFKVEIWFAAQDSLANQISFVSLFYLNETR